MVFWREPDDKEVKGSQEVYFRVGRYVGKYQLWIGDPPKLESGYFIPPMFSDLWQSAVHTTMPRLRSLQAQTEARISLIIQNLL